ncbi:hypothetical protein CA262_20185 [Sphingobium sp. GW456-12-10-14-TSB1]|nr:hypothetical protein CA262_20185 [Sphingobium sp. GW456-12-10-14-TSB1]
MPRRCDLWRIGIMHAGVATLARHGLPADVAITWLDEGRPFTFDADPFGWWHEDRLHLFVEHYDYRSRHGVIDCIVLDAGFRQLERRRVVEEPWHLSYPAIFESEGSLWMLPEAYRSGELTLYRCRGFPFDWEPACTLPLGREAIDATPFHHGGRWWLFFSSSTDRLHRMGSLHIMHADRIEGPWSPVQPDPVRLDLSGARPAGRPFLFDGRPVLPVQDCSRTYGGAIRLLHFDRLDAAGVSIEPGAKIEPSVRWKPFHEGLHTINGCGPVTLIDAKRIDRSGRGWLLDAGRMIRKAEARRPA